MGVAVEFPTKRISVGALIRDRHARLLLVKPTYRDGWLLPGGIVDVDESPRAALVREIREELGLTLDPGALLCVDYVTAHGEYADGLHLLFDGGCLSDSRVQGLHVCDAELQALQWATPEEAQGLLVPSLARRLQPLRRVGPGVLCYLENGEVVGLPG